MIMLSEFLTQLAAKCGSPEYHAAPIDLQTRLLTWHQACGRKNLPWQQSITPYRVWLSEIMLQQTQVNTVINYFTVFTQQFPNIGTLAAAEQDRVLHLWTGLGYYARARNLHQSAKIVSNQHGGQFPQTLDELITLPGIGRSTAGAILSIAMKKPAPILDGNVKRVLSRLHMVAGWPGCTSTANKLWEIATYYTPDNPDYIRDYTQAIMDLGATVCTRSQPKCDICPVKNLCAAYKNQVTHVFPHTRQPKKLPTRSTYLLMVYNTKKKTAT